MIKWKCYSCDMEVTDLPHKHPKEPNQRICELCHQYLAALAPEEDEKTPRSNRHDA